MRRTILTETGRTILVDHCPLCGREAELITFPSGYIIKAHGSTDVYVTSCAATGFSFEDARAMARIREEGGERFRLAAHP